MALRVARMNQLESDVWLRLVHLLEVMPPLLDAQLQRDADLSHFEFMVLSGLRFAPERTLRMKELAAGTNSTLPRLSHVVSRLEARGLVQRFPCPEDRRATNARLTDEGRRSVIRALPGHLAYVRSLVLDPLSPEQLDAFAPILEALSDRLEITNRIGRLGGLADGRRSGSGQESQSDLLTGPARTIPESPQ